VADALTILLIEDNPEDVEMIQKALENGKVLHDLQVVTDGFEALDYLRGESADIKNPRPDLILLDLTLPLMDGWKVLEDIKTDPNLRRIPVVVLTNSLAEEETLRAYDLHANSYIIKPMNVEQFFEVIKKISQFWLSVVMLPSSTQKVRTGDQPGS